MNRNNTITNPRSAMKLFVLGLAASAAFMASTALAETTINPGETFIIDDSNTTAAGTTKTWTDTGTLTIYDTGTLRTVPSQISGAFPTFVNNNDAIVCAGSPGTVSLQFNGNDMKYVFNGAVSCTAAGDQIIDITTGLPSAGGNGDRENVYFASAIANGSGGTLGLQVTFNTQSGANSYVNLPAVNTFTGPITLTKGNSVQTGYLVIGGERYMKAFDSTQYTVPGSGSLGGGNYTNTITLDTQTAIDFNTSANQVLSGVISGFGQLIKEVSGTLTLSNLNTYTGNTTVSGGTLVLASTGGLTFLVTDAGANKVTGAGSATLNGTFTIDTSGVTVTSGSWILVDTATKSFGTTFSVAGFTAAGGGVWTLVNGSQYWTFIQATGTLYLGGAATILSFGIPGSAGVIDDTLKTIALTVPWNPWGASVATLAPTFTLSSGTCNQTSGSPPSPTFAVQNPATYTVIDGLTTNNYAVTVTVTPASTNKVMSNVYFPGLGFASADSTGTNFTIYVPSATDVTALAPTYTVSQLATGSPVSGTVRNFTTPQTYTVTAEDGSQQGYKVTVVPGTYVATGYQALVLASGPVSYWPLNETSGTTALDIASGVNNATYSSPYTLGVSGLRADGNLAVYFPGTSPGQASVPYTDSLNPPQFTLEFWCAPSNTSAAYVVAEQDRTTGSRIGFAIQKNNFTTGWDFTYGNGTPASPNYNTISSGTPVVAGQVYYIVASYDGTSVNLYVDGVLVNSAVTTYQPATSGAPGFSIGSRNGNTTVNGVLQDVALYNRALTLQEIQTHYQNHPFFYMNKSGSNLILSWVPSGGGTLQAAPIVSGTYTNVPGAKSPYTNVPSLNSLFWRVKF